MNTWSKIREFQPLAERIITNSIKKGRISHAYLIQGERGTGKEEIAVLIAKVLFCENRQGVDPCLSCLNCRRIDSRNHPDVHWIEPDGKSIKTEQIENLQKEFFYTGMESNQKVYIIKNADTLTVNASNRILKFLEEPKRQTTAIMLTENSQLILPTIRSRCQVIELKPLNPKLFQQQLVTEGILEKNALFFSGLTNNIQEALEWNEDPWFAETRALVVQLLAKLFSNPSDIYLYVHSDWLPHFKDRNEQEKGLDILLLAFKDILYYQIGFKDGLLFFDSHDELLEKAAFSLPQERIAEILQEILEAKRRLKQNVQPTFVFEQLMLQIKE